MSRRASVLTLALALAAGAGACGADSPARPTPVDLGGEVTLAPGQSAATRDGRLEVRFFDVAEDSRCPRDVTCVWAGEVTLRLRLAPRSQEGVERDVKQGESTIIDGLKIEVLRVQPVPVSTRPIARDEYRATLRVSTAASS